MKDKYHYLNYIDDLIVIINNQSDILFVNDSLINSFNVTSNDLNGQKFNTFIKEKDLSNHTTTHKEINEHETIVIIKCIKSSLEWKMKTKIAKEKAILDSTTSLIIEDNSKEIISCNKSFLDFFGIESLEEFKLLNKELPEYFLNKDVILNDYNPSIDNWIVFLEKIALKDRIIYLKNKNNGVRIFSLTISEFKQSSHILCFNDITEIQKEKNKFEKYATIDSLTNIFNRRTTDAKLHELIKNEKEFFLVLFDIDNFKYINDTYGYEIGDKILKIISEIVKSNIRTSDFFARWGGEEFIIIFENINKKNLISICEKIRKSFMNFTSEELPKFTASFGVTKHQANDTIDTIFTRADINLYEAKSIGKNKIVSSVL